MRELKQDIADVVWTISQADWGETTTTEDRERKRLIFTNKLLALFTASQAELKEESSARLDMLQFMTDWVENHICEITAMREALQMARQYIQEAVDEGIDDTAEADLAKIDTVLGGK